MSVTRTVMTLLLATLPGGVQENAPEEALMVAPAGGVPGRLKVSVCAGRSSSVADAVKTMDEPLDISTMPAPLRLFSIGTLAALCLALGCSREPQARNVTGPDGSPMLHVACGKDQGACFELAGRGCPYGYKVFPIFDPHDNNFLIRCHAAHEMAAVPAEPPAAVVGPPAFAPAAPVREAWTGANASIVSKPPPTTGTKNDSAIDLGY